MTNSFNIVAPETCACEVLGYMKGHSYLEIKVAQQRHDEVKDTFYLEFEGVEYYEGPMRWKWANFSISSADTCLEIIHRLGYYANLPDDFLLERFKLFVASTITAQDAGQEVKILAMNGGISKTPSPFFQDAYKV
jgi:hypothetical protein